MSFQLPFFTFIFFYDRQVENDLLLKGEENHRKFIIIIIMTITDNKTSALTRQDLA